MSIWLLAPVALLSALFARPLGAASLTVNWNTSIGTTGERVFGLNAFQGFDPQWCGIPGSDTYKSAVATMAPGILRLHHWGMLDQSTSDTSGNGWLVDPNTSTAWARTKITNAMTGAYAFGPQLMLNIPKWPPVLADSNGRLKSDKTAAFAAYCADLVRIVNIDLGKQVRYWEVTNEQDGDNGYGGRMGDLAVIYRAAATAMRQVDPTIKIGGPAFARPDLSANVDAFIAGAVDQLDFISYHTYTTGDGNASAASVWDSAAGLGWATTSMRAAIARHTTRSIETFHNEFNISYSPPDVKMTNAISAVYDALAMTALARVGVTGAMAWNEADGWYGKCDNQWGNWASRPAAYVYRIFNEHLRGRMATISSNAPQQVDVFAVAAGRERAIALINRSGLATSAPLICSGWQSPPIQFITYQVTATGLAQSTLAYAELASGVPLPQDSVTVLVAQDQPDAALIRGQFGRRNTDSDFDPRADLDRNGRIDAADVEAGVHPTP